MTTSSARSIQDEEQQDFSQLRASKREESWRRAAMRRSRKNGSVFDLFLTLSDAIQKSDCSAISLKALGDAYKIVDPVDPADPLISETEESAKGQALIAARQAFRNMKQVLDFLPQMGEQLTSVLSQVIASKSVSHNLLLELAEVGEFVLLFDWQKLNNPQVQNALGLLHRYLHARSQQGLDDLAAVITFVSGTPSPVLRWLKDDWATKAPPHSHSQTAFAICAKAYLESLSHSTDPSIESLLLRGLTFSILMYSVVSSSDPQAFSPRKCTIDMPQVVTLLKSNPAAQTPPLLNFLRFSTFHFNKSSPASQGTPEALWSLVHN